MRKASRDAFPSVDRSSETGSVGLPLLLLGSILASAAFGALGYATLWRSKANLQLRLDRCVESVARELVSIQNAIEEGNLRIKAERAAAAAAAVPSMGASIEEARPVLEAEVAFQEVQRGRWLVRQAKWIASRGCDGKSDAFWPLPNLRWSRKAADAVGPQPLEWDGNDARLAIRLWRANRFAQARVARGEEKEDRDENGRKSEFVSGLARWRARWIPRDGK